MSHPRKKVLGLRPTFPRVSVVAAQREFEKTPSKTFEKATTASPLHMLTLLNNFAAIIKKKNTQQMDKLMLSIHSFLDIYGPSEEDTVETFQVSTLIMDCLEGMYRTAEAYGSFPGDMKKVLESSLATIVRIQSIGFEQVLKKDENALSHSARLNDLCAKIFLIRLSEIDYTPVVDDIFEISMKVWASDLTHATDGAVACISMSGSLSAKNDLEKMRRIVDGIAHPKRIAHLAMMRLQGSRRKEPPDWPAIIQHCNATLAFADHPAVAKRMVARNALGILCDTFGKSVKLLPKIDLPSRTCLFAINKLLPVSTEGLDDALENDLLLNLALTHKKFTGVQMSYDGEATLRLVKEALDERLPPLLVCLSSLKTLLNVAMDLNELHNIPVLRRNSLGEKWAGFEVKVFTMAVSYRLFSFYHSDALEKCKNPECAIPLRRKTCLRCAGCKEALYCGRWCQRKHWKVYGHRYECCSAKNLTRAVGPRVQNRAFLTFIACDEVLRHRPALGKVAAQRFPHLPVNEIGYEVDLTRTVVVVDIYNIAELGEENNLFSCTEHMEATRRAVNVDPNLVSLRIKVGRGDDICILYSTAAIGDPNKAAGLEDIFDSLQELKLRYPAIDINRQLLEPKPGLAEWIMLNVRNNVELKDKDGVWDISLIDAEIRKKDFRASLLAA